MGRLSFYIYISTEYFSNTAEHRRHRRCAAPRAGDDLACGAGIHCLASCKSTGAFTEFEQACGERTRGRVGREGGRGKYEKGIEVGVRCGVGFGVNASKTHVYLNEDGSRDAHKIETRAHASNNNGWCLRLENKMFYVTEFSEVMSLKMF